MNHEHFSGPTLEQFNGFIRMIQSGNIQRSCLRVWELQFLLDFESCGLQPNQLRKALRLYQQAGRNQIEAGQELTRFSEFLGVGASR